jgi:uncharacterized protein YchJ
MHECLSFADHQKDLPQILRILENENYTWLDSFVIHLAHAEIKGALPRLKELLEYHLNHDDDEFGFTAIELEEAVIELESGIAKYPEQKKPTFERRRNWKDEYKDFYKKPEPVYQQIPVKKKKIGRNEPCPCGSGKKYKRCCLNK